MDGNKNTIIVRERLKCGRIIELTATGAGHPVRPERLAQEMFWAVRRHEGRCVECRKAELGIA